MISISDKYDSYFKKVFNNVSIALFSRFFGKGMHLFIIGFGNAYTRDDKKIFEYELHVQTTWRIINYKEKKIVLTENDLIKVDDNYFYAKIAEINSFLPAQIKDVIIKNNGDMDLYFGDDFVLQVINCNSKTCFRDEAWRIVHRRGIKEHFVMPNEGISLSYYE